MSKISIAIDGPSGAGKSTLAKMMAKEFGFIYVDTGAMYRAIGLYVCRKGVQTSDIPGVIACLDDISVDIRYVDGAQHVFLNDEDVSGLIRTEEISRYASAVSAIPEVRAFLLSLQRTLAQNSDVIMDGRDIGTVVLPDAPIKVFLTANDSDRAMRRYTELKERGEDVTFEGVLANLRERDRHDSERAVAPLRPAEDAVLLDTTGIGLEESAAMLKDIITEKMDYVF